MLKGWRNQMLACKSSQVNRTLMARRKSPKLLNGASLFSAKGFLGLSAQDEVSGMLQILDSETVNSNALKKTLQLAQ